jgi:hypothetical protein
LATATYIHQHRSTRIITQAKPLILLILEGYNEKIPAPLAKGRDFEMVGMAGFEPTIFGEIIQILGST